MRKEGFTINDVFNAVKERPYKTKVISRCSDGSIRDYMRYYDNAVVIHLHNTPIIVYEIDKDTLIINTGGWRTLTTARRINKIIGKLGYAVYQSKGDWYISDFNEKRNYEFYEGWIIENVMMKYNALTGVSKDGMV